MKWLESAGVQRVPALRAALEAKLASVAQSKPKSQVLKAGRAAKAVGTGAIADKLQALQEKQLDSFGMIDGDWLVLGDKSGSMTQAIATAREVAAILARMVKGKVHLVFFDTDPTYYDVTGMPLDKISRTTAYVKAGGGTSIGCGLALLTERGQTVDGIAIVSDGGENNPPGFAQTYKAYEKKFDQAPSVYLYRTRGDANTLSRSLSTAGIDFSEFDLTGQFDLIDYSSLPNIVLTMRVGKYGLLDEIMATPLRRLDDVLAYTKGMEVLRGTDRPTQEDRGRQAEPGRRDRAGDGGQQPEGRVRRAKAPDAGGARRRRALSGA
jgi:hypothetical protein